MSRTIRTAFCIMSVIVFVTLAFGTFVPTTNSSPYVSSLANVAVSTAEACPCNNQKCNGGFCGNFDFWGCCIRNGNCFSTQCF